MAESTGISAQDTDVQIEGTPGSAITITGITKAASAVVTATNTLAIGDDVEFGTVAGMPEIKGRIGHVTAASGSAFTVNIDSSGFATVGTTGTANKKNWTLIGNVKNFNGFDGQAGEIDKSHLKSDAKEFSQGLQDFGSISISLDVDDDDAGQTLCRTAARTRAAQAFRIKLPNGNKRLFKGYVRQFTEAGSVDAMINGTMQVRITGTVNFVNV